MECTDQDVGAGDGGQLEVLDGALLQLHVRVADLAVGAQHLLDGGLGLGEQVDELDVGRQQQGPRGHRAQVELGVEEVELDQRAGGGGEVGGGRWTGRRRSPWGLGRGTVMNRLLLTGYY